MASNLTRFRRRGGSPATAKAFGVPSAWRSAGEAYALVTLNYKSVAKIGVLPLFIVGALQTLYAIYPTVLNLFLTVFGNLAAAGMFTVGLQQMVMKSKQNQLFKFQFAGRRVRGFVAVMLALIPVILLALGILALGQVLAQMITVPTVMGLGLVMAMMMGTALVAYTAVRFSVIMPAIALDEPIDLQSALRATRGRAWQLWRGLMATLSPVLIVAALLAFLAHRFGASAWAASGIQGFTVITSIPLAAAYLTVSYFRYIRRTAKPKMKIIGEPGFSDRMKLRMKRYADFMSDLAALLQKQFKPKPKNQSALHPAARRAVYPTPAAAAMRPRSDLARQVAEKLVNLEEDKLAQIAEILSREGAGIQKTREQTSAGLPPRARAQSGTARPTSHTATPANQNSGGAKPAVNSVKK